MSDHRTTTETELHRLQSTRQRHPQGSSAEADAVSSRRDPLAQVTDRIAAIDAVGAHAAMLSPVTAQRSVLAQRSLLRLQRQHGNRYVQRALAISRRGEGDVDTEVAPQVEEGIERKRGNGQTLDSGVRARMEPAFGVDFSGVRTHTDNEADTLNRAVNARAFTTGQDIFFRQGEYDTSSSRGRELLAHELTHVVQQTGVVRAKLGISQPDDAHEREADEVARQIKDEQYDKNSEEKSARNSKSTRVIQRKEAANKLIQRRLNITGTQANVDDYLACLERMTGYDLTWAAPGPRVTIAGNNEFGTRSPTGRRRLRTIINDATQHAQLTIGTHQHQVGVGAWPGAGGGAQTIDIDDIRNLNTSLPGHGDAKAFHEMVENYDANSAATLALPAGGRFTASHRRGVEVESDVLEESTIRGRRLEGGVAAVTIPAPTGQPTGPNIIYQRSIQHFTHYNLEMIFRRTITGGVADFEIVSARRIVKSEVSQRAIRGFATNSPAVPTAAPEVAKLNAILAELIANPTRTLLIEVYTDSSGSSGANLGISRRRAEAIRAWFTGNGIARNRIAAVGRGETNFVATNATAAGRERNRRAVLTVHG